MPTAISALTGVQWTDLNGANLSTTEKNNTVALVENINAHVATITGYIDRVNASVETPISFNDLFASRGFYYTEQEALNVIRPYATTTQAGVPIGGGAMYLDTSGQMIFAVHKGSTITRTPVPVGHTLAYARSFYNPPPIVWSNPVTALDTQNISVLLNVINANISPPITATDKLSFDRWQTILNILTRASYQEASKLTVADGGGLKTYGGRWYANGQEVSYLDITFAVRVNQLFVINDNVTTHLSQLQKNNAKIKLANQISSIVSNLSPTSSSGTVNAQWLASKILSQAIKAGVVPAPVPQHRGTMTEVYAKLKTDEATLVTLTAVDSRYPNIPANTPVWLMKYNNGAFDWKAYDPDKPLQEFVGVTKNTYGDVISTYNFSTGQGYDLTALLGIMPSSLSKLFNTSWGQMLSSSTTLNQTDCTTITTELKAYTSNLDSENQLLQTNLSQLNDKRSEVLDSMSSLIKGTVSLNNDMARNLGAV